MSTKIVEKTFSTSLDKGLIGSTKFLGIEKIKGDASGRKYFRVNTTDKSYIVCLCDKKDFDSFTLLQKVFSSNGVPVPKIIDTNIEVGYLLQEDLGGETLWDHLNGLSEKEELATYKVVLDHLAKLQKIDIGLSPSESSFDQKGLFYEVDLSRKFLVEKHLKYKLSSDEREIFREDLQRLCKEASSGPFVLNHRDFHSRNIMYEKGPVFIDFQDARAGIAQYDLASLLDDCYFEINLKNVEKLKKYYFENYIKNTDYPKFLREYDLISIQRLFKAVGTFAKISIEKGDDSYLKYIPRSFEKLVNRLGNYPEYIKLNKLLLRIKNEN
jgi:aminoglycoside/choline kinase family phosphotransferase